MKKILMFAALAVVPFLFSSCTSTSKEDVIYEIGITMDGGSHSGGNAQGESYDLYKEIRSGISLENEQWIESVTNGDSSAADAKAIAKYDAAEAQIKAKVAEYQTKIDALQDNSWHFSFSDKLYLRKFIPGGEDKELKSYSIKLSNEK